MGHLEWFNEKASIWDTIATDRTRSLLKEIIQRLRIAEGSSVLDVATGTGILTPWLMEAVGPGGRLVALDFSPEMIARAKEKFGHIESMVADVHDIPIKNEAFDEVICNSAFPHFTDQRLAMAEMVRVLRTGGRLTLCHPATREELNEFHKNLGGVVGADMLPCDDEVKAMAASAGLKKIVIADGPHSYVMTGIKA